MKTPTNPRQKKLDAISGKIAVFIVQETYTDEPEAQRLAAAAELLVKSDELHAQESAA
jgi:hypothetical protein